MDNFACNKNNSMNSACNIHHRYNSACNNINSMNIIRINSLSEPGIDVYSSLTDKQLKYISSKEGGLFIAESPKVIKSALDNGYQPVSMLCEERHVEGDAKDIIAMCGDIPVYVGERSLLASLTGYVLTRGVLCAMRRKPMPGVGDICQNARRVVVINGVVDTTNIGAIFRSAAALGMDAVILTRNSCDPLNRRSVRVSMGSVFRVPWTWADNYQKELNGLGFKTVAMALTDKSLPIDDKRLKEVSKLAIVMGTEGDGLPQDAIDAADYVARIPMFYNVDSLNVAAASAVAFWELRKSV